MNFLFYLQKPLSTTGSRGKATIYSFSLLRKNFKKNKIQTKLKNQKVWQQTFLLYRDREQIFMGKS